MICINIQFIVLEIIIGTILDLLSKVSQRRNRFSFGFSSRFSLDDVQQSNRNEKYIFIILLSNELTTTELTSHFSPSIYTLTIFF